MKRYDMCWLKKASGFKTFFAEGSGLVADTVRGEAGLFFDAQKSDVGDAQLVLKLDEAMSGDIGAFAIKSENEKVYVRSGDETGLLYGLYELLRRLHCGGNDLDTVSRPQNFIRMLDHWDNFDGTIERGYSGHSLFYEGGEFRGDFERITDYARLLASVGINAVSVNNVNVKKKETGFLKKPYLDNIKDIADIFERFGIKLFLSVNFASPVVLGGLKTADPLDDGVIKWWRETVSEIYKVIPGFGGFVVKADSEGEPGPFTYERDHAEGANLLAGALAPHNGFLIWRCFVYNCRQDWRDRKTDRARAAFDNFKPLDGKFMDNVALQIKNGPMDFQIREPVSPLLGAMPLTNEIAEFQVTQEYTGQQKHVCYLVPLWKETLDFNTYSKESESYGQNAPVTEIVGKRKNNGIAAVSNVGIDYNWTGHKLAQANLYGFGRLCWDPGLSSEEILIEWIRQTFDLSQEDENILFGIMADSRLVYENYTSPLGVGWMVKPNHHYGPDVDGYEYDRWGTYHFADRDGIGVDRSDKTGTGYAVLYNEPNASTYNNLESCPDELLLFFHHVPYTHVLKSGKTVIQHIYDTHFKGYEQVLEIISEWKKLEGKIDGEDYDNVLSRLGEQERCAREWRDQVNTYFFRKSGIADKNGRTIYK